MAQDELNETQGRRAPRHSRHTDPTLKARNILNIIFMLLAVAGLILFMKTDIEIMEVSLGGILIGAAILVKIAEVLMRMLK